MPHNEHKKVLMELSEAYSQVNEGHAGPVHNWKQQAGVDKMHTFGNVQIQPLGKNQNGAEGYRVHKDGKYVLYATEFNGTFTTYAQPSKDGVTHNDTNVDPAVPLMQLDNKQIRGGLDKLGAALGAEDAEEGTYPEDWHENEKENKPEFKEGQYVKGIDGLEIISYINKQGAITTYVLSDEGNHYKPGTDEYEELEDWDEHVKYDRMSTFREPF